MTPIRTLLIDDHELVRTGLRAVLDRHAAIAVVGEGSSGDEALRLAADLRPDVVLMDLALPGMNGVEATSLLTSARPAPKVIVVSAHDTAKFVGRALRAGARGYVLKHDLAANLATAVIEVHAGRSWFSAAVQDVIAGFAREPRLLEVDPLDRLSRRQRSVLQLIAEGRTNRQIAETLGIGESTVDTHRTELMRRLDLHDVASVVRFAYEEGIVGAGPA